MAEEPLWYVLLVNKARVGDHWLLKRLDAQQVEEVIAWRGNRWFGPCSAVKTRSYRSAVSFPDADAADRFLGLCGHLPPGYLALVVQITPPRPRRRPSRRHIMTPYGPVTLLEGQLCLFGEDGKKLEPEGASS